MSVASLYEWLGQSNAGTLCIRGEPFTIDYFQGGARGQGRIRIEASEFERLKQAMRVRPRPIANRPYVAKATYPGITVKLGRPDASGRPVQRQQPLRPPLDCS